MYKNLRNRIKSTEGKHRTSTPVLEKKFDFKSDYSRSYRKWCDNLQDKPKIHRVLTNGLEVHPSKNQSIISGYLNGHPRHSERNKSPSDFLTEKVGHVFNGSFKRFIKDASPFKAKKKKL